MKLILIDEIEGVLVGRVSGVCSPGGHPSVVKVTELGVGDGTQGQEMTDTL